MFRDFLHLLLLAPDAGFMTTGVPVMVHRTHIVLFAKLGKILGDGAGLQMALEWVGHAGVKPCFRHFNVMKKDSGRASHSDDHVEITCPDPSKFKSWTEAEFLSAVDMVIATREAADRGDIPKVRLETVERAFGLKCTKDGLLASSRLRERLSFQSTVMYDWVHTFLQVGVISTESWLLIDAAMTTGVATQADIRAFLKLRWRIPLHRRHQGR